MIGRKRHPGVACRNQLESPEWDFAAALAAEWSAELWCGDCGEPPFHGWVASAVPGRP